MKNSRRGFFGMIGAALVAGQVVKSAPVPVNMQNSLGYYSALLRSGVMTANEVRDIEMLNAKLFSRDEIARIFQVPQHMIGGGKAW